MEDLIQTNYALDTFYFLVMGVLVMFMAPGFAMLEAGMVRAKNTSEILTKNVALFAIACIMYMTCGYFIMYPGAGEGAWLPLIGFGIGEENTAEAVMASGGDTYYSARSDHFFQVVFVATAMSIVSGAVAERMKLWAFLVFAVVMTGFHLSRAGVLEMGWRRPGHGGLHRLRRFRGGPPVRRHGRTGPAYCCSGPGPASTAGTAR